MAELERGGFEEMWGGDTPLPNDELGDGAREKSRKGRELIGWGVLLLLSLVVLVWCLGSFRLGAIVGLVASCVCLIELRRVWESIDG